MPKAICCLAPTRWWFAIYNVRFGELSWATYDIEGLFKC